MCKKLIFLISLLLVLGLVGNASAYEELYWSDDDPCDHLWSSPLNWDVDRVPVAIDGTTTAGDGDVVHIEPNTIFGGEYPIIDDGVIKADPNTGSFTLSVIVGAWETGDAYLTMTGGYICTKDGWDAFILGLCESTPCSGTLNMTGGLIELYGAPMYVGDTGIGYLNMTDPCGTGGGIIDTGGGQLALPGTLGWWGDSGTGSGHIDLEAGSIICGSIFMRDATLEGVQSTIDVNGGTLIIEADVRITVAEYVDKGWITASDEADPRFVSIEYDYVNGLTIVTYEPNPDYNMPWRPIPGIGERITDWTPPILSWQPGQYADTHTVYFGTSLSDINESATPVSVNQPGTTYPLTNILNYLEFDRTYYWRINEVNIAHPCSPWEGPAWQFKMGDYVVVEDFDSYLDYPDLRAVWNDESTGGHRAYVYVEKTIVRDGSSMKYEYYNDYYGGGTKPRYSEAWVNPTDLTIGTDWTPSDAKALRLYFYGQPGNVPDPVRDRMWVALSDGSGNLAIKNYAGDMNDIKKEEWQEWNIKLQDFNDINDVNLASVSKVYIGFGVRAQTGQNGSAGTVYFDDVGVHPTKCVDEFAPAADVTGECLVDYADFDALAGDWLLSDYNIVATPPSSPVGWWKLDEGESAGTTAVDSAGDSNGTLGGLAQLPRWLDNCGDPCHEPCLDFDGVGYVDIPNAAFTDINDEITVTLWQYGDPDMQLAEFIVMFHACDACSPFDLTIKGEFFDMSAEGCEVYFDAGFGGDASADSVSRLAIPENYKGQWNHYAYTKNANTGEMKIYLNGVLFADQGEDILVSPMTGTEIAVFKIGSYYDGVSRLFDGYMSDFRLYNYALSYGEVRYVAGQMDDLYIPLPNPDVDLHEDGKVNFKDYAVLANDWLVERLWP